MMEHAVTEDHVKGAVGEGQVEGGSLPQLFEGTVTQGQPRPDTLHGFLGQVDARPDRALADQALRVGPLA
jgi:hypothetical protein